MTRMVWSPAGGQGCLDGRVERRDAATLPVGLVGLPGRHLQPPRGLARFHAPVAVQLAGLDVEAERSAGAEVAVDLAVPASQSVGIGESPPTGHRYRCCSDPRCARCLCRLLIAGCPGCATLRMCVAGHPCSFVRVCRGRSRCAGRRGAAPTGPGNARASHRSRQGAPVASCRSAAGLAARPRRALPRATRAGAARRPAAQWAALGELAGSHRGRADSSMVRRLSSPSACSTLPWRGMYQTSYITVKVHTVRADFTGVVALIPAGGLPPLGSRLHPSFSTAGRGKIGRR